MALDRYGPRRTQTALLTVAAAGALLFGLGSDTLTLALARALIGAGVSGCLLASFKIFALWLPKRKLPLANGLLLACGGAGVMASSAPAQAAIEAIGWRDLFHLVAAATPGGFGDRLPRGARTPDRGRAPGAWPTRSGGWRSSCARARSGRSPRWS